MRLRCLAVLLCDESSNRHDEDVHCVTNFQARIYTCPNLSSWCKQTQHDCLFCSVPKRCVSSEIEIFQFEVTLYPVDSSTAYGNNP